MKKLIYILIILTFASYCFSAPSISSVSGTIDDGESIVITGSSFGSNDLNFEWTKANIDAGTPGADFAKTDWSNTYVSGASQNITYSNVEAHTGQSLLCDFIDDQVGMGAYYDFGAGGVTEAYITGWVYLDKNDAATRFQWKNARIKVNQVYGATTAILGDLWYGASGWDNNNVCSVVNSVWQDCYPQENDAWLLGTWQRFEYWYQRGTINVEDGEYEWRRIGRSGSEVIISKNNILTHNTGDNTNWRYILLGHYYGNLTPAETNRDMNIYYDDLYLSQTRSRVEIGNNEVFTSSGHKEIQIPTAWSGTEITIELNAGSYTVDDNVYVFVVDAAGDASPGYAITIGGEGEESTPGVTQIDTGVVTNIGSGTVLNLQ